MRLLGKKVMAVFDDDDDDDDNRQDLLFDGGCKKAVIFIYRIRHVEATTYRR